MTVKFTANFSKLFIAMSACGMLAPAVSEATIFNLDFPMQGSQEVPPVVTQGSGNCNVSLDDVSGTVSVSCDFSGLGSNPVAAHIHGPATAGVNAGVILALSVAGDASVGSIAGNSNLSPADVASMLNEQTYINLHTASTPSGELRGQITGPTPVTSLASNDGLGDAGIFQYYTVQGGWQTFIRLINTSEHGASVKLRFREAANSREVLDFIVFLSPFDTWIAWTDQGATGLPNAGPGIRTNDTSCVYPDSGNVGGQGWINIAGKPGVRGISFQDYAFTGIYDDGGTGDGITGPTVLQRMSEGHIEVIGIARHKNKDDFTGYIRHETDGHPDNCSAASSAWRSGDSGAKGEGLGNVLAMNAYLINVGQGQGAGYEPDILANFIGDNGKDGSLWEGQRFSATEPDLDSAIPISSPGQGMKQKGFLMNLTGAVSVTGGVDAVSYELQRASVINEWAASENDNPNAVVTDYFSQWVLTFPTKHYYVDLATDDINLTDDISPTLADPGVGNDAYAPFYEEFDYGDGDKLVSGKSCESYRMRMWNREERWSSFTSPSRFFPAALCYETNVLVFNERYEDQGLNSNFAITVPMAFLPTQLDGYTASERGWASMDFYGNTGIGYSIENRRLILDRAGLPVTGFMFSVYNTNNEQTNHTAINAHKYRRETVNQVR